MSTIWHLMALALLSVGVDALDCAPGMKTKTAASALYCAGGTSHPSCQSACCDIDQTKCPYQNSLAANTCPTNQYFSSSNNGNTATASNFAAQCCMAQAACPTSGTGHCSAGYKPKTSVTGLYCSSAATDEYSCSASCCEADSTQCAMGMATNNCGANQFADMTKYRNTFTSSNYAAQCCTNKAACPTSGTGHCSAGYKPKASVTGLYCSTDSTSATSCSASCCEIDNTKCLYHSLASATTTYSCSPSATTYLDPMKYGSAFDGASAAGFNTACCSTKSTCSTYFASNRGTASSAEHLNPMMAMLFAVLTVLAAR